MIIKKEVNYDLECKNPPVIEIGSHELNVESFSLVISLYQNYKKLEFDSGDTVTAALVSGGILIDSERECTIEDNKVTLDITNRKNEMATVKAGRMLVELSIKTSTNEVYVLPTAFIVRVEKSILDNAIVTEDSVGSVAEVIKEVVAARDIYPNLGKRLNEKANYKNVSYSAGGTGGLNTACDPDTIYNVCFNASCNNVPQGTKGILFATDENTQILITDKGDIFYRNYNLTEDIWGEFTSVISNKVSSVDGVLPDNNGNVNLLVKCGHTTDLASCTDESKVYYFDSGMSTLNGNTLSGLSGIGGAIGFIKKIHTGWLFISSGVGAIKTNHYISENGTVKLLGGTFDYEDLSNKPKINDVELTGNKTLSELDLYSKEEVDEKLLNKVSTVNSVSPDTNGNVNVDMSFLSNIQPLVVNSDTKIPIDISTEACLVDGKIGRKIIVECKNATGIRVYGKDYTIAGTNEIYFQNQTSVFTLFFDTTNKKFIASATATDKNYTYPRYCKFATIRSNWISNENTVTSIYSVSCNFNYTINGGHLWNEKQIVNLVENYKTYNYFTDKTFATEKLGYNISKMYSLPTKPEGTTSAQGMAINNGVIFQMYNDDKVTLIDYSTGQKITTLDITSGHGDTAEFSNEKYAEDDEFNLLYTTTDTYPSQVRVHRITRTVTELIKTLTFPIDKTKYFAGHCTDFDNGIMYQVGYATNSYYNAENNYMVVSKWNLNALTENSDGTLTPSYLGNFNIPFMTTVQDQMFYDGKLFLVSSHWENPQTIIYVVDPTKECVIGTIDELPTEMKNYELEGIDKVFNGNKLNIILSLNKGVYKMTFD